MARTDTSDRVAKHRAALRAAGLRPIQIWVPDVRSRSFASKAHRQSFAVGKSRHEQENQEFIDEISDRDAT
ncbi:MAG: antitoxin MazE family protein [Woeseiaceae bacterium]